MQLSCMYFPVIYEVGISGINALDGRFAHYIELLALFPSPPKVIAQSWDQIRNQETERIE